MVDAQVDQYPVEPGRKARPSVEPAGGFVQPDERVLRDVARVGLVAEDRRREPVRARLMAVHHKLECVPSRSAIFLHSSSSEGSTVVSPGTHQNKANRPATDITDFPTNLTKQPYDSFTRFPARFDTPAFACKRKRPRHAPSNAHRETTGGAKRALIEQEIDHEKIHHNSGGDSFRRRDELDRLRRARRPLRQRLPRRASRSRAATGARSCAGGQPAIPRRLIRASTSTCRNHPEVSADLQQHPDRFMATKGVHENHGEWNGAHPLATTDRYMDSHPEVAQQLDKDPALVDNRGYVDSHPGLHEYLQNHPIARRDWRSHPYQVHGSRAPLRSEALAMTGQAAVRSERRRAMTSLGA